MKTLLIADADPDFADVVASLLCDAGYAARTATDAPGVIAALRRGGFDAVLCDPKLPGLAPAALWAGLRCGGLPLVLTSARSEWQLRAAMPGRYVYLGKPFTHYALCNAVRTALREGTWAPPGTADVAGADARA